MDLLGSLGIAFSMYSRIPVPRIQWTGKRMEYAMCFFPLVGFVIGLFYIGFGWLCGAAQLSETACACFGALLPVLVTGGIHMDGFADTVDALSSFQPREKKLEILKDPHTGAFAVIGVGCYLLAYAGLFAELLKTSPRNGILAFAAVPVISRSFSGLSVVSFPKAKKDGLAAAFAGGAKEKAVRGAMAAYLLLAAAYLIWSAGLWTAVIFFAAALLGFGYYYHMCKKQFGGMTGDLAGYFLQMEELLLLFAAAAAGKAGLL